MSEIELNTEQKAMLQDLIDKSKAEIQKFNERNQQIQELQKQQQLSQGNIHGFTSTAKYLLDWIAKANKVDPDKYMFDAEKLTMKLKEENGGTSGSTSSTPTN